MTRWWGGKKSFRFDILSNGSDRIGSDRRPHQTEIRNKRWHKSMGTQKTCWKGAKCAGQMKDHRRKSIGAVGGKLADNRQQRVKNHKAQLVNILAVGTVSLTSCLWPGPSGAETGELNFDKYQGIWWTRGIANERASKR